MDAGFDSDQLLPYLRESVGQANKTGIGSGLRIAQSGYDQMEGNNGLAELANLLG